MSDNNGKSAGNGNGNNIVKGNSGPVIGRGRGLYAVGESRQSEMNLSVRRTEELSKRGKFRDGVAFRENPNLLITRPDHVEESKLGKEGKPVQLLTNHFQLISNFDFKFLQYRVDFLPEIDDVQIRKVRRKFLIFYY